MFVIVCYDVNTEDAAGRRRLRKVAKKCESHGQRAQKSVFECLLETERYLAFEAELIRLIDKEKDQLRIYFLDEGSRKKTKQFGVTNLLDLEAPLVI
ncbi:MAG: CRISPR-associated endonuclease Cas2 [Spirochaetes bacterium]|nr:CRISPR-associated endonuclease Cas2 [Spirochaetota bacterium]